jgi:plastocyanin
MRLPIAIGAAAMLAAGCGTDVEREATPAAVKPPAPSTVLDVSIPKVGAKPWVFSAKKLTAKAGLVQINLRNDDIAAHNIRIQTGKKCCDPSRDIGGTDTISGSTSATAKLELEPGTYWFICSINSHYDTDMGRMKGKLTVQ